MITTPTLLLNSEICKKNMRTMHEKAKVHDLELRPHFKTHQSLEIGRWFKAMGTKRITVSSLEMAAYFSKEWHDITVAFPVNLLEIDRINLLAKSITLNLLVESIDSILFLKTHIKYPVNFLIKINIGNDRAGLLPNNFKSIDRIINASNSSNLLKFIGFLGHAGQTYNCRNTHDIIHTHLLAKQRLVSVKQHYQTQHPNIISSYGDTPSCSIANDFEGIDEIRPGNYVFYDLMQVQIGACAYRDIAIAMTCPIVAIHEEQEEIIIYGGGIHFSKECITDAKYGTIYGLVVTQKETNHWNTPIDGVYVKGLSQEHGVIHVPKALLPLFAIGGLVTILPVHSCMTANLMKSYIDLDKNKIEMMTN